jgi:hypothetical protein
MPNMGETSNLPWNSRERRWRVRWWQVLLAALLLAVLDALVMRYMFH